MSTTDDIFKTANCLKLLEPGPQDLPDTHRAIIYLIANKHTLPITSTLIDPGRPASRDREEKPIIRRWELHKNYTTEQVQGLRLAGGVEASNIRAHVQPQGWAKALESIQDPIIRDAAADRLRGWW